MADPLTILLPPSGSSPQSLRRTCPFDRAWQPADSPLPRAAPESPWGHTAVLGKAGSNFAGALPPVEALERELSEVAA